METELERAQMEALVHIDEVKLMELAGFRAFLMRREEQADPITQHAYRQLLRAVDELREAAVKHRGFWLRAIQNDGVVEAESA